MGCGVSSSVQNATTKPTSNAAAKKETKYVVTPSPVPAPILPVQLTTPSAKLEVPPKIPSPVISTPSTIAVSPKEGTNSTADLLSRAEIEEYTKQWQSIIATTNTSSSTQSSTLSTEEITALQRQWEQIAQTALPHAQPIVEPNRKHWKEVRLFISSTFTDYFAEREVLVKSVVPRLREWCESRRLTLIDIDLRWGVPAESTTETILRACLSEIDRAREANGNPFFLNMLGQRYGWVPSPQDVPASVATQYQWVPGISVTHMEILCGALRDHNPNALFLLRSNAFVSAIPSTFTPQFLEAKLASGVTLQALRHHIQREFGPSEQVFEYSVGVKEVDSAVAGIPKLVLDGLEEFGERVFEFMQRAIDAQYPLGVSGADSSLADQLGAPHEFFMEAESELVLGREEVVARLLIAEAVTVLTAARGIGKSAVVALAAKQAIQAGHRAVFFSAQAKSGRDELSSAEVASLQLLLCLELGDASVRERAMQFKLDDVYDEAACEQMRELASGMCSESHFDASVSSTQPAMVFLDEYDPRVPLQSILPLPLPPALRLILTTTAAPDDLASIEGVQLSLSPLDMAVRAKIVERNLGVFNKRLSAKQLEVLLAHPGTAVLKWLYLACEEIRMFGAFETVTDFIETMADTVRGLLEQNLRRNIGVARNYGDGTTAAMIKDTLLFLYFEEGGLRESELMELLAARMKTYGASVAVQSEETVRLVYAEWATVHLFTKAFTRSVPQSDGSRLLVLDSGDARAAVEGHFKLLDEEAPALAAELQVYARALADYFESSKDSVRRLQSYPLQLLALQDDARILTFKASEEFEAVSNYARMRVVDYLRCRERFGINGFQKVHEERFCMTCSMRVSRSRSRTQSCFTCGARVFTMQQPQSKGPIKLWAMEKLVYRCRRHNFDSWTNSIMRKCCACRMPLPQDLSFSYAAIKCTTCSFGDNDHMYRCCNIRSSVDEN